MHQEKFIFCLEGVPDAAIEQQTAVIKNLEKMAFQQGLTSIYKTCDTIEGLEESLSTLLYDDNNFQAYEIIYLVIPGEANGIGFSRHHQVNDFISLKIIVVIK